MEFLYQYLSSHFLEFLVLLLFFSLFFKEGLTNFLYNKLGMEQKPPKWGEEATKAITSLAHYANHNTTEKLESLIRMGEKHATDTEQMHDTLKDMSRTLEEIKEYGIVCRKK